MSSTDKNKAGRGCWTCKDRRVRCDRGLPRCANCARVQQKCQGYGVRLSWPKEGDTKRSLVGRATGPLVRSRRGTGIELVHTSYFDIEMYYYLLELHSSGVEDRAVIQPDCLILPPPMPSRPTNLNSEEVELLRYFQSIAFSTLATFSSDLPGLRDTLVRMALTNHTIPSRAVLHAILALSSLHRDGLQLQATRHKTVAVGALGASAKTGIQTTAEAAQHLAANMLLCSFEIHMGTDSQGHWPLYLMGARDVIAAAGLDTQIFQTEIGELVLWAFYHDVMARFSIFHWRRASVSRYFSRELGVEGGWQRDLCAFATRLKLDVGRLPTILRFFGDIIDALCESANSPAPSPSTSTPASTSSSSSLLQEDLHAFERAVRDVPASPAHKGAPMAALTELYRTAVLVYVARVCEGRFGEARDLRPLLERGFAQLGRLAACERIFPVFVLGCEADTDERRVATLALLRRTEDRTQVRSLDCLRRGLESVWIQDDLHADQDVRLDYVNKLNAVISSSPAPPVFV
ncbi:fungal-specific transcription factor domain-containing protein [Nemania serpens]|nr:fungal-specific transcription factor domain-containing protein [Nemania serpens]